MKIDSYKEYPDLLVPQSTARITLASEREVQVPTAGREIVQVIIRTTRIAPTPLSGIWVEGDARLW